MQKYFMRYFRVLCVTAVVTGCTAHQATTQRAKGAPDDPVVMRLEEAATAIHTDLQRLVSIKSEPRSAATRGRATPIAGSLAQVISFRWAGPIGPAVKALSEKCGLTFDEKGRGPAQPLVVNVNAHERPLFEILEDIGIQAGNRAELRVVESSSLVELIYAGGDR